MEVGNEMLATKQTIILSTDKRQKLAPRWCRRNKYLINNQSITGQYHGS